MIEAFMFHEGALPLSMRLSAVAYEVAHRDSATATTSDLMVPPS